MGKRVVKNYPSPRLMETIGATNQKPNEAIGELVANCFDARLNDNKLTIYVDMRNDQIQVIDDGKGMTSEILERAVCIAEDMSKYIERGEGAKGQFGMGFKTSCSTLGRFYEIFTRPENENREYHVGFDISDYSQRPSGADAWDIEIEDYKPKATSPLKNYKHGTAFVISRLKDKNIVVSSVLTYLGEAFKGHLKTGDKIYVIDSSDQYEALPKNYDYIPGSRIEINEVFGPKNKYTITGWMALDRQTHNDGFYGFNIYRHNQLVEKWDKSWFTPHLMTSRIIGEVNMDFLEATFYKQGVQQLEDWKIINAHMTEFLKSLVSASRAVSRKGNINKPSEVKRIVTDLNEDYGVEIKPEDVKKIESSDTPKNKGEQIKVSDNIKTIVKEQSLILEDEGEMKITYLEKESSGDVKAPYDYIFAEDTESDDDQMELQVIVFKTHPLWKKKIDESVLKIIATSDAIYRVLVEKLNFETSEALKIRNEWVNTRSKGFGE